MKAGLGTARAGEVAAADAVLASRFGVSRDVVDGCDCLYGETAPTGREVENLRTLGNAWSALLDACAGMIACVKEKIRTDNEKYAILKQSGVSAEEEK